MSGVHIVYRFDPASGRTANRKKLAEMIDDLKQDDVVIVENIDHLTRLPIKEAVKAAVSAAFT